MLSSCLGACFGRPGAPCTLETPKEDEAPTATLGEVSNQQAALARKSPVAPQRRTALHLAAESGHVGVLQTLFETLLCSALAAASSGNEGGADPQSDAQTSMEFLRGVLNARDSRSQTPLLIAAARGHSDCVRFLLCNGADRSRGDAKGNTPLHVASARGYLGIVLMLCSEFAEEEELQRCIDAPNEAGFTPLHHAVWGRQSTAVQILLQHGANMMATNTRAAGDVVTCPPGTTPLHLAACRGHVEISRILLKSWMDRVVEPMTASTSGGPSEVAAAIAALDPRAKANAAGHMPYQLAQRLGFFSLALLLRPHIPIMRLFSAEERNVRFYGPPQLKAIAAAALNKHLVGQLDAIMAATAQPIQVAPAAAPSTTAAPAPLVVPSEVQPDVGPGPRASPGSRSLSPTPLPRTASSSSQRTQAQPSSTGALSPTPRVPSTHTLLMSLEPSSAAGGSSGAGSGRAAALSPRGASAGGAGATTPRRGSSRSYLRNATASTTQLNGEGAVGDGALGGADNDAMSVLEEFEQPQLLTEVMSLPGGIGMDDDGLSGTQAGSRGGALVGGATINEIDGEEMPSGAGAGGGTVTLTDLVPIGGGMQGGPATTVTLSLAPSLGADGSAASATGSYADDASVSGAPRTMPAVSTTGTTLVVSGMTAHLADDGTAVLPMTPQRRRPASSVPGQPSPLKASAVAGPAAPESLEDAAAKEAGGDEAAAEARSSPGACVHAPLDEEDEEEECGVCMEHPAAVLIAPCSHVICGPCARKMCSMSPTKPSSCPFCRSLIAKFAQRS